MGFGARVQAEWAVLGPRVRQCAGIQEFHGCGLHLSANRFEILRSTGLFSLAAHVPGAEFPGNPRVDGLHSEGGMIGLPLRIPRGQMWSTHTSEWGRHYGWKPSSSSNFSIRAFRACPLTLGYFKDTVFTLLRIMLTSIERFRFKKMGVFVSSNRRPLTV